MFDTCSPASTIHYDDPTKSRIIKIGKKRTCSRVCKANDVSTGSGEEGDIELASEKGKLSQNLITKEIQELLPDFNGTSAPSLLNAIEAWKRILGKSGVHRDLWEA